MPSSSGLWLYAVTRRSEELSGLLMPSGIRGLPVTLRDAGDLVAVTTMLDLDESPTADLETALNDLPTLEPIARAHHAVIATVAWTGATLPARLATIISDDESLDRLLADRRPRLHAALDQVAGRTELGVKIFPGATPTDVTDPAGDDSATGAGARYLQRRRAELDAGRRAAARTAATAQTIYRVLARHSQRAQQNPVGRVPRAEVPLLNGAFLVYDRDIGVFLGTVDGLRAANPEVRVDITGPWPAYSFAEMSLDEAQVRGEADRAAL
ncbi:hypothetical protein HDA40_001711 [Hamadaea flava]|uniref:GvpL/GvpF family gas vesicle protein n=1 Tax=Hamadaea flava TaxID=1742688 RepID=A0ABV8LME3_9ACTN|nr:GvpL/GvpF family gas vesicle protein [Hamadaea flava]MCP2323204.1 hypothetical protein [Hamadaea flava]